MAINFCNPAFGSSVTCSSVSADGYEPENLLRPGTFGQWKGFLAEHFIKPPLNVTFTFPFEIDICSIVIDPNVSSQHSSGVEIFSATLRHVRGNTKDSTGAEPEEKSGSAGGTKQRNDAEYGASCPNMPNSRAEASVVSTNIGKGYCNNGSPRLILFTNRRYRPRYKELSPAPSHDQDASDVLTRDLRSPSPFSIRSVDRVVVRITRVEGGSVPALRRVEIWGQPAQNCNKNTVQRILETDRRLRDVGRRPGKRPSQELNVGAKSGDSKPKTATGSGTKSVDLKREASTGSRGKNLQQSDKCPEEFIDPITCNMMVIPILLPSGHTIDKVTLEKHQETEATWGRPPNDPFTGVPFSQISKPIPNVKLKVRIDKFLLSGGTAFQNVPRTTGVHGGHHVDMSSGEPTRTSVLLQPKQPVSVQRGTVADSEVSARNGGKSGIATGSKMDQLREERSSKKRQYIESGETSQGKHEYSLPPPKKSRTPNCTVGHEQMVSDSLDDALALTLASLPSYSTPATAKPEVPADAKAPDACVNCSTLARDCEGSIYSMPCGRLICRRCTAQVTNGIVCQHCKQSFKTSDLSRVHAR